MTTTDIIEHLAADIVARTVAAAEAEAEAPEMVWRVLRSWWAPGMIEAEFALVCERFGCTEESWFTDHDRFSATRDALDAAVEKRLSARLADIAPPDAAELKAIEREYE